MVTIKLNLTKSLEENAATYFEAAKKARKKIMGVQKAIALSEQKLSVAQQAHEDKVASTKKEKVVKRKSHWYEKFRWFFCDGLLVIGGRDATTNELIIKKHMDKDDVVFHTDMAGSPFFVIKTEGEKVSDAVLAQVANATFVFSRALKLGMSTAQVFYVTPEQVTKEAQSGEFLPKGAFMIRGKTTYLPCVFDLAIGAMEDGAVCAGPRAAVESSCVAYVEMQQGDKEKPSDVAKAVRKIVGGTLDEVIRVLPPASVRVKKNGKQKMIGA